MPFNLRRQLWSVHRWLGLPSAVVLLLLALSGMAMLLQGPLNLVDAARVTSAGSLAGIDAGVQALARDEQGYVPILLTPPPSAAHGWQVYLSPAHGVGPRRIASIDGRSGEILDSKDYAQTRLGWLLTLHTQLFGGRAGQIVLLAFSVVVIALAVAGVVILQRRWRAFTSSPFAGADRWRSLHRWSGIALAGFVIAWALSGFLLQWSMLAPGGHTIATAHAAVPAPMTVSLRDLLASQRVAEAGEVFAVGLPTHERPSVAITVLHRSAAPWAKFTVLEFDAKGGHLLTAMKSADAPFAARVITTARSIHMGLFETSEVRILYLLVASLVVVLTVTGPAAWLSGVMRRARVRRRG